MNLRLMSPRIREKKHISAHQTYDTGYGVRKRLTGDVVDDDGDSGVPDVTGNEGAKSFLSRRVPQLQTHRPVLQIHRLGQEVDPYCGLVRVVKSVIHEPGDEGRLSHCRHEEWQKRGQQS